MKRNGGSILAKKIYIKAKLTLLIPEFKNIEASKLCLFKNLKRLKRNKTLLFHELKKIEGKANSAYSRNKKD
jgi:hypothetical protein